MSDLFAHYDETQALFINDVLIAPIVLALIFFVAKKKLKNKKEFIYKKYFLKALSVKMFSSIALALIYQYYYHGGDTMIYFAYALKIKDITNENFMAFLDLAFNPYFSKFNAEYYLGSQTVHFFMNDSSRFIIRITLYLSILLLNSYLSISFIFSL